MRVYDTRVFSSAAPALRRDDDEATDIDCLPSHSPRRGRGINVIMGHSGSGSGSSKQALQAGICTRHHVSKGLFYLKNQYEIAV